MNENLALIGQAKIEQRPDAAAVGAACILDSIRHENRSKPGSSGQFVRTRPSQIASGGAFATWLTGEANLIAAGPHTAPSLRTIQWHTGAIRITSTGGTTHEGL